MNFKNYYDHIRIFTGIVEINDFTDIPFAGLRREYKPGLFSLIETLNVIITIKIAQGIYGRSNGLIRSFYKPDYKEGFIFIANLIPGFKTILVLLPILLVSV